MRESRLDDPQTTQGRREILRGKGFLRRIYGSWYGLLKEAIPGGPGKVLEIG